MMCRTARKGPAHANSMRLVTIVGRLQALVRLRICLSMKGQPRAPPSVVAWDLLPRRAEAGRLAHFHAQPPTSAVSIRSAKNEARQAGRCGAHTVTWLACSGRGHVARHAGNEPRPPHWCANPCTHVTCELAFRSLDTYCRCNVIATRAYTGIYLIHKVDLGPSLQQHLHQAAPAVVCGTVQRDLAVLHHRTGLGIGTCTAAPVDVAYECRSQHENRSEPVRCALYEARLCAACQHCRQSSGSQPQ